MGCEGIGRDNTVFVFLSFEGPDAHSPAGGPTVGIGGPAEALASMGFPVHLFFIGDHGLSGERMIRDGRLSLHRWCQWISRYYPRGTCERGHEKLRDFSYSVPWSVSERVVKPAARSVHLLSGGETSRDRSDECGKKGDDERNWAQLSAQ
jgi:hypothetical protein